MITVQSFFKVATRFDSQDRSHYSTRAAFHRGLGTVRIMYALNTSSFSTWTLTYLTHVFECYFWWSSALGRTAAILEAQGVECVEGVSDAEQILKAMVSVREVSPAIIHQVLLLGVPLLCVLLLANIPSGGRTDCDGDASARGGGKVKLY